MGTPQRAQNLPDAGVSWPLAQRVRIGTPQTRQNRAPSLPPAFTCPFVQSRFGLSGIEASPYIHILMFTATESAMTSNVAVSSVAVSC